MFSQINGPRQLLDLVEQVVSLLYRVLVQPVPLVGGIGLDNSRHLVDLAGQSACADQLRQLPVDEVQRYAELVGHGFQLDGLVGFEELRVDDHSGLPDEVADVMAQVGIALDQFDDFEEDLEELPVPAVVEGLEVLLDVWQFHEVDYGLRGLEHFLLDADAVHVEDAGEHAVGDQLFVGHHFGAVEGGQHIDEEFAGGREVADDQAVDALVDLELVLALPVAALLEQLVALVDVLLDLVVVLQHQVDAHQLERDVHLLADLDGALQGQVVGLDGELVLLVLVVELGLGQQGVPDLGLAEVLLRVLDLGVPLLQELLKGLLNIHLFKLFLNYNTNAHLPYTANWGAKVRLVGCSFITLSDNIIIKAIESMNFTEVVMKHEAYSSTDIVKKCKKYPQFYQQCLQVQTAYFNDLNMSIYADLQDIEYMQVFQIEKRENIYMHFYGYLMPPYEELTSKFYLLWIRMLDQLLRNSLGRKYTVIYYHSLCQSNIPYNFLCLVYKKIPLYYYAMLDRIITVEATYFLRKSASMFEFGRLNKLFERKIEHIEKISEFANLPEIVKYNLLDQLPEKLMNYLQEKTKKKMMKNGNLMAYHQSLPVYSTLPKKDYLTVELTSYKLDQQSIPIPLKILLTTLKENKSFLQLEGIFRKSGSIEEEELIIQELSRMGEGDTFKSVGEYSGYAYAGVVKKFFTKLVSPIVPYEVYDRIMTIISSSPIKEEEEMGFMLDFIGELPELNRKVIVHLLVFLREEVISRQEANKMSSYNTSVCFFPCVFKSRTISEIDLINSGKFVGILKIFFNRFEEILKEVNEMSKKNKETPSTSSGFNTLKDFRMSMA